MMMSRGASLKGRISIVATLWYRLHGQSPLLRLRLLIVGKKNDWRVLIRTSARAFALWSPPQWMGRRTPPTDVVTGWENRRF
eukprot:6490663-Amphidinium_carterae.3